VVGEQREPRRRSNVCFYRLGWENTNGHCQNKDHVP
jgi:hypothetical protein